MAKETLIPPTLPMRIVVEHTAIVVRLRHRIGGEAMHSCRPAYRSALPSLR